jgi:hypothetical protein
MVAGSLDEPVRKGGRLGRSIGRWLGCAGGIILAIVVAMHIIASVH